MHLRRPAAVRLALAAVLLTAPLTSCGFDLATDRVNDIAPGATERDATVDVLNAVVVSGQEGSGVFVTTLSNNDVDEAGSLESVAVDDPELGQVGEFSPVEVDPGGLVNLAAEGESGIPVEGEGIAPGKVVPMTLELSGGQVVQVDVPVVANCGDFAGIDGPGGECEVSEPAGEH
jgi:hypothetical protein